MENKMITLLLFFTLIFSGAALSSGNKSMHLLIYEVSPYSYSGEHLDYVCIVNPTQEKLNLSSYILTDFEGYLYLSGYINSGEKMYIAENATAFKSIFGFYPDYTYDGLPHRGIFKLGNSGDEVALIHHNVTVDIVIYGNSDYRGIGWKGQALKISEGHILRRINYLDTDTAEDWTDYHRIGQSEFKEIQTTSQIEVFTYPDDSREVFRFVSLARDEILIESYTISNIHLCELLEQKIREGVRVKILLEGNPVGGISEGEMAFVEKIYRAGGEVYFMISGGNIHNRYTYLHSKFIVVDSSYALISTENFDEGSISPCGNRGYGVIIRSSKIAKYLANVFLDDAKNVKDIAEYRGEFGQVRWDSGDVEYRRSIFSPLNFTSRISLVVAPDYSIDEFEKFVYSQKWIDVESLYLKDYALSTVYRKSRRILVNHPVEGYDMKRFNGDKKLLRELHAKLMVGDSAVLVGSMNFGFSSMTRNREVSVIIWSNKAVNYFEKVFDYDWNDYSPPMAIMDVKVKGNDVIVDLSQSTGTIKEYRIFVDGKLVYDGKSSVKKLTLENGRHFISAEIIDYEGNSDHASYVILVREESVFDLRIPVILFLIAVFLYKIWKNHGS